MKLHADVKLSVKGRERLIDRVVVAGWSLTQAAEAAGVTAPRASGGTATAARAATGCTIASQRRRSLTAPPSARVEAIAALRRLRMAGAAIAEVLCLAHSTVSGTLTKIRMGKLGLGSEPAQRYERERPGELIHIDVKKLDASTMRRGHRVTGKRGR
jgi:hypothetical protein